MADLTRRIVLELLAKNRAAGEMAAFSRSIDGIYSGVKRLAGGLLALAGVYGVKQVFSSLTAAAMEEESAERRMAAALRVTGDATDSNIGQLERYAKELQKLTIYGDEEILQQMSMAKSTGASTRELDRVTIAAIGLSAAYNKDLGEAMRFVTLASQGQTGQLKRMGIVIDQNLSPQEKYNQLLALGAKNFDMAVAATQTAEGSLKQYENALHSTKAAIGSALLPAMSTFYKTMRIYLEENQADMKVWAEGTVDILTTVVNAYLKAQRKFGGLAERAATPALIEKTAWDRYLQSYPEEQKRQEEFSRKTMEALSRAPFGAPAFSMLTPRIKPVYPETLDEIRTQLRGEQETIWDEQKKLQKEIAGRLTPLTGKYELPTMDLSGQEKIWGQSEEEMRKVVEATREAMESVRNQDYLTRIERIESLRIYQRENAATLATVGEANKLLDQEIRSLERSRLDAMKVYNAEMLLRMQEPYLVSMDYAAEYARYGEGEWKGFWDPVIDGSKDASQAVDDFFRNLAIKFAQLQAQKAMMNIWDMVLGPALTAGITGAFGGLGSSSGMIPAGTSASGGGNPYFLHSGGIVGRDGVRKSVPFGTFENAPRFHSGLGSDEFPSILKYGEKVTSVSGVNEERELLRKIASLLEQRQTVNLSANVVDHRDVVTKGRMESKEGEKYVMYHTGRNSG